MKYIIILFLSLTAAIISAQSVNGVSLDSLESQYIRIVGTQKFLSTQVNVDLEFGQRVRALSNKEKRVLDDNGKPVTLNSMIDALNFFDQYGYEFVTAYVITVSNQNVYHYLMRRKKD